MYGPSFEHSSPEPIEHTEDALDGVSCTWVQKGGRVNASSREKHSSCNEVVGREAFYMGSVVVFLDLQRLLGQASTMG